MDIKRIKILLRLVFIFYCIVRILQSTVDTPFSSERFNRPLSVAAAAANLYKMHNTMTDKYLI